MLSASNVTSPDSANNGTASPESSVHQHPLSNQDSAEHIPSSEEDKTSESSVHHTGQNRGFQEMGASRRTGSFLGIPSFDPPVSPTLLFNPWAYLFGPLYFLVQGMWRKGLSLALLWILCQVPSLFSEHIPLQQALIEEYAVPYLLLMALSALFTLLFCMGQQLASTISAALFGVLLAGSHAFINPLSLGNFSAFVWLNAGLLWTALGRVFLFSLLGKNLLMLAVTAGTGIVLYLLNFPLTLAMNELPSLAFPIFCGMMGSYDLYRAKCLKQKFWW